ncbi:MAG: peptide chain release factor N(5)-glutamine methyltransferase [Oscillospiraceae bacterium]|nr:peptide chain release factor N(5)-glutamine methyltransferase [Oscillospiraceae bacterium]
MTIRQAIQSAQKTLQANSDARFDALCLAEKAFALSKTGLRLRGGQPVDPTEYFALVSRRASGEPLQYILGEWEFYGLRFAVGPGVLIPRPETELLVEVALNEQLTMNNEQFTVVDLCAGSGCVGLSIAHHCPNAKVYLVELSGEALPYLRENAEAYQNAEVIAADVLNCSLFIVHCSLILANPPYVRSDELASLPPEVRREPRVALDGGADGLKFYRALAERWLPRLAPGRLLACECGDGQAADIAAMFTPHATSIMKDFNGIDRVVLARKQENT